MSPPPSVSLLRDPSAAMPMMMPPVTVAVTAKMRAHTDGTHVNADADIGLRNCRRRRERQRAGQRKAQRQQRFSGFCHFQVPRS
jgi:hypothetical protein